MNNVSFWPKLQEEPQKKCQISLGFLPRPNQKQALYPGFSFDVPIFKAGPTVQRSWIFIAPRSSCRRVNGSCGCFVHSVSQKSSSTKNSSQAPFKHRERWGSRVFSKDASEKKHDGRSKYPITIDFNNLQSYPPNEDVPKHMFHNFFSKIIPWNEATSPNLRLMFWAKWKK